MLTAEVFRTGCLELWAHKARSLLTFFAISIGTASFLSTFSTIATMNKRIDTGLKLSGLGRINIDENRNYEESDARGQRKLSYADAVAIRREMPDLYMVSPVAVNWNVKFRHGAAEYQSTVLAITPEWAKNDWAYTLRGRFLTEADMTDSARVCVVIEEGGWEPGKKPWWMKFWDNDWRENITNHFKHAEMLGETVMLQGHAYKVVGVIKEPVQGTDPRIFQMGSGQNILVPMTTYIRFISGNSDTVRKIDVDAGSEAALASAKRRLEVLLKTRHDGAENFQLRSIREVLNEAIAQYRKQALTILAIGAVALLAGGIGIMNVTLAVIFSRIKEIGIRRAIGATRLDIMSQFVTEATLLGFLGGTLGIAFGYTLLHFMTSNEDRHFQVFIWWVPAVSLLLAAGTGFLFSLYPAYTAAKLDPVEALRYE
ncbi:MAG: ABC transporter permease [Elusimicrobiales bacterium]|nr:ABC transporter permease [Elusimicrobiales bacterium]